MVINRAPPLINMCGYYWPIESLTHHYKCKYQNLWYGICITKHKQRCTTVLILRTNLVTCIKGCCKVRQDCDEDSNSEQLSHLVFNGNHQKEIQTVKGDERKKIVVLRPWCRIGMAPSPTVLTFWSRQTARLCFHPAHIASSRSCHLSCRHVDTFQFPDAPDQPKRLNYPPPSHSDQIEPPTVQLEWVPQFVNGCAIISGGSFFSLHFHPRINITDSNAIPKNNFEYLSPRRINTAVDLLFYRVTVLCWDAQARPNVYNKGVPEINIRVYLRGQVDDGTPQAKMAIWRPIHTFL